MKHAIDHNALLSDAELLNEVAGRSLEIALLGVL